MTASSDFAVTNRRMVIYSGNYTFPIAIMQIFRENLYVTFMYLILVFTNYTKHSQPYRVSSYKRRVSNQYYTISQSDQNKHLPLIRVSLPNATFIRNLPIM